MRSLVVLDTETGGLSPESNALVEVAWSVDGAEPTCVVLPHDVSKVAPQAMKVNHYLGRELYDDKNWSTPEQVKQLSDDLQGCILVGANIGFDKAFLAASGFSGWHYRSLDIESYALPIVGTVNGSVPGLRDITDWLASRGHEIPAPDHTATGDVRTTMAVFSALQSEYDGLGL